MMSLTSKLEIAAHQTCLPRVEPMRAALLNKLIDHPDLHRYVADLLTYDLRNASFLDKETLVRAITEAAPYEDEAMEREKAREAFRKDGDARVAAFLKDIAERKALFAKLQAESTTDEDRFNLSEEYEIQHAAAKKKYYDELHTHQKEFDEAWPEVEDPDSVS